MKAALPGPFPNVPLRRVVRKLDRLAPEDSGVVTAFRDGQVTLRSRRREDGFTLSDQEVGYQGVEPGDLVIHGLDAFAGAMGVSDSSGRCTPVYHVCGALHDADLRYVAYALRAEAKAGFLELQAGNVRQRAVDFRNWQTLAAIEVPLPPAYRQRAIADFLGLRLDELDRSVDRARKLDTLIDERARASINALVFEGPKSAGSPLRRVRMVAQVNLESRGFGGRLQADDLVTFLPLEAVWPGDRLDTSRVRCWRDVGSGFTRFVEGDVLVPKITPTFEAGRAVVARGLVGGIGVGSTELHVLRPGREIDADFLAYVANTTPFLEGGRASMFGVAGQQRVTDGFVRDFRFALPSLSEQKRLASELRCRVLEAAEMRDLQRRRLALILERRDALITAALTGQLDIPGVAA
jgi:type I restriction enzyme S subunit